MLSLQRRTQVLGYMLHQLHKNVAFTKEIVLEVLWIWKKKEKKKKAKHLYQFRTSLFRTQKSIAGSSKQSCIFM